MPAGVPTEPAPLLHVRGLEVAFPLPGGGWLPAVAGVDLEVGRGRVLAVIGESGSGKSSLLLGIAGLLPATARLRGQVRIGSERPASRPAAGRDVGMIFQSPGLSLNPVMRVGALIGEVIRTHRRLRGRALHDAVLELLGRVGIAAPERRARAYPHELSGGQRQRVAIAAALAGGPSLLLADEPTTALDAMTQARILDLLLELVDGERMGLVLVTHDLAVAGAVADDIALVHAGRIVERGPAQAVVRRPLHPYGRLLAAALPLPNAAADDGRLPFPEPPVASAPVPAAGCGFAPRCPLAIARCRAERPPLQPVDGRPVACWRAGEL